MQFGGNTERYWVVESSEGEEQRGKRDTLLVVECEWKTEREPHVCGLASPPLSCRRFWVVTWSLGPSTSEPSGKGFLTDIPYILSPNVFPRLLLCLWSGLLLNHTGSQATMSGHRGEGQHWELLTEKGKRRGGGLLAPVCCSEILPQSLDLSWLSLKVDFMLQTVSWSYHLLLSDDTPPCTPVRKQQAVWDCLFFGTLCAMWWNRFLFSRF